VDGSIDTAHIADNQITLAKMAGIARGKIIYGDASGDPAVLTAGSNGQVLSSDGTDISWAAAGAAADDITAGDSAVLLTTSSGNITIDAAASDSDIIFKGTDGGVDTTFATMDGSAAGHLILNNGSSTTTLGTSNYIAGLNAGAGILSGGNYNIFIGENAGTATTTGDNNVAIGNYALDANTTASDNTAVGSGALGANTTAYYCTATGSSSLGSNTTGQRNVAVGYSALVSNTTGSYNTALGFYSGYSNTTSEGSTAVGYEALLLSTAGNCTALGFGAGDALTTGTNNTIIGFNADASAVDVSNEITLGNASIATLRCQVTSITALSDRRDKKDIVPLELGLDFVNSLNPVKFTWNTRDGAKVGQQEAGFIAQELDEAQIAAGAETYLDIVLKENLDKLEAAPGKLIPVLVKAIQDLSAEVATLKEKINGR
jgi:trimeric autotransporter adhesin